MILQLESRGTKDTVPSLAFSIGDCKINKNSLSSGERNRKIPEQEIVYFVFDKEIIILSKSTNNKEVSICSRHFFWAFFLGIFLMPFP